MGIEVSYRRLSTSEFEKLVADPTLADDYFGLNPSWDDKRIETYYDQLWASDHFLTIDKTWHGLHFLLTGDNSMDTTPIPPPLGNVVLGGTPTEWEATYGMIRFLSPLEVKEVSLALEAISEDELAQRYDPNAFLVADIYPSGVWDEEAREELLEAFSHVKTFFSDAAREGEVVLLSSD